MMLASLDGLDVAMGVITSTMTVAIVWIIAHHWRKTRVAAYNARLKQLMLERGMSAAEIERVLQADGKLDTSKQPRGHRAVGIGCVLDNDCCTGGEQVKSG